MRKRFVSVIGASLWLAVVLCGQTLPGTVEDRSIFGPGKLHPVSVSLSKDEWDVLQTSGGRGSGGASGTDYLRPDGRLVHIGGGFGSSFPWVHADVVLNGVELKDIGLRYKGNNSFSRSSAAAPLRANFKLKTDLFGGKADWNGVETLNFHAAPADSSLMREAIAFAIFRAAGVPASRTAYLELTFNVPGVYENTSGGFYTLIENVNKRFLKQALPPGNGLLLKPEGSRGGIQSLGPSWASYIPIYRPDRDATLHEQQRVIEFANLVSQPDVALFRDKIGTYLDVDAFLRFIAVNAFIVNGDSYLNGNHNYYVYLDPKDDKFRFIPWDLDLSMRGVGSDILRPAGVNNSLIYKLLDDPAVAEKYRAILKELAATVFATPVVTKFIADIEQVIPNRDPAIRTFLATRVSYIESLVAGWSK